MSIKSLKCYEILRPNIGLIDPGPYILAYVVAGSAETFESTL